MNERLIPAHAGSTTVRRGAAGRDSAHPRSRGEHWLARTTGNTLRGSSPLTRGAQAHLYPHDPRPRLIPAHAGSTDPLPQPPPSSSAHPRSRGEHRRGRIFRPCECGSSPLTRGARDGIRHGIPPWRLIPAHAGSTAKASPPVFSISAHPRSRGEHAKKSKSRNLGKGSSPLARGTPQGNFTLAVKERLIPACAGNTAPHSQSAKPRSAHPRSRREHSSKVCCVSAQPGSSPLARGTPDTLHEKVPRERLIPAHAGNTLGTAAGYPHATAHPRSRGEHHKEGIKNGHVCGSSPLARGTLLLRATGGVNFRLIPARAGNTR